MEWPDPPCPFCATVPTKAGRICNGSSGARNVAIVKPRFGIGGPWWTGGPSELRFGSLGLWTGHIVRQRSQNGPDFVICPYISLKRIQVSTQSILHWSNHPCFWWFTRPLLQVSSDHCPTMPHWKRLVGSDANGARVAWSNDLGSVTLSWPLKIGQSLVKRGKSMVNQW